MSYVSHTPVDFLLQNDSCICPFFPSPVLPTLDQAQMIWDQDTWLVSFLALGFLVSCNWAATQASENLALTVR